jgi:hypothetical protein
MLVLGRRAWSLAGVALTGLGLAALSLATAGPKACGDYAGALLGFARTTAGAPSPVGDLQLRLWKYVDLNSFWKLLLGGSSWINWVLIGAVAAVPLWRLARLWVTFPSSDESQQRLTWAATLTLTTVVNLYVGVYDTVLGALGALVAADVLAGRASGGRPKLPAAFATWLLLGYLVPWFSQPLARATGFQLYTWILLGLAASELRGPEPPRPSAPAGG